MTSPEITLIITTVFTGIVSVIGALKGISSSTKLDAVKERSLVQDVKLDTIHNAADGNFDKALKKIDELMEENKKLKEDILDFNKRKRLL